ncbi:uncharacterized protein DUF3800 [Cupriavidus metallidurans]|jgi:hypothetical protein|uniref:DUF3800 domain-containing protein n=1 Tax=Cupriavidus TaxID=106589 RepID=UPI0004939A5B|nr:DUF3800 domain-containing protein [Cupriavidus metallidurans]KWW35558.1 hypothetical protein AU374_03625 [Cupriavidus metallidurans]MDE4921696.1 DUF3800 domain-containing protein [Cupriavidus metallidurans]
MYIFVDESGTFTLTDKENAWCTIAAFVLPESKRRPLEALVSDLRFKHGAGREVKLGAIPEGDFIKFLTDLEKLGGVAFALAVNVSMHRRDEIQHHHEMQVDKIRQNIDRMKYEGGRRAVADLADEISALPLQLYTQLVLQAELVHTVLQYAPLYYVQREPVALAHFRWRVDQKDRVPNRYEKAFKKILPGLLQTMSLRDPMIFLKGEDYRHFKRFEYEPGTAPTYLKETYGLDVEVSDGNCVNVGRIINDDFSYVDSQKFSGVQVADMIASGVRRVLRSNFDSPERVALALGMNMLQAPKGGTTVRLLSLDQAGRVDEKAATVIRLMGRYARPMLAK